MIVHVHATYCHLTFFMMEMPKIVVLVVKRYAVLEAQKWRYAVRNGGGGVILITAVAMAAILV